MNMSISIILALPSIVCFLFLGTKHGTQSDNGRILKQEKKWNHGDRENKQKATKAPLASLAPTVFPPDVPRPAVMSDPSIFPFPSSSNMPSTPRQEKGGPSAAFTLPKTSAAFALVTTIGPSAAAGNAPTKSPSAAVTLASTSGQGTSSPNMGATSSVTLAPSGGPSASITSTPSSGTLSISVSSHGRPESAQPSQAVVTYVPGELTVFENGLRLSTGLKSRLIAQSNKKVQYKNGTKSSIRFHGMPDGAAVFPDRETGGWIYVSNSEERYSRGGVGALRFDRDGDVVDYRMILTSTSRNCQGGKTPWSTWVSCEETRRGQCWETDPFGNVPGRKTQLGGLRGGHFEAVACDHRDPLNLQFFVTNDRIDGEVRRFVPNNTVVNASLFGADPWNILSTPGEIEYLVLYPEKDSNSTKGRFSWTKDYSAGKQNAASYFQKSEGIDFINGKLYFVASKQKEIFILDIDTGRYRRTSTKTRRFGGRPDSLKRNKNILYVAEERTFSGVYGRDDVEGQFFTVLRSQNLIGDATGIAFDPYNKRMYVAIQKAGKVFEITREDGQRFTGRVLELTYHNKNGR